MLIFLPALYFWAKFLWEYSKPKTRVIYPINIARNYERTDLENDIKFDPPVYKLRYATVQDVLLHEIANGKVKKIVEFGCAEMKLFDYIKYLFGVTNILLVDIDKNILQDNLFRLQPQTVDYLNKRTEALEVCIFSGSISEPDCNLINTDAVIGIEIIEHLYPDVLDAVPHNIFGYIQPNLVILSTPNADFNVLFSNFKGFRHFDHKFEWTREQFMSWCLNVTERYPQYNVTFSGVGDAPLKLEHLGYCSQIAIFRRISITGNYIQEVPDEFMNQEQEKNYSDFSNSYGICTYYSYSEQINRYENGEINIEERNVLINNYNEASNIYYKLIEKIDYPYYEDNRTMNERMLDEMVYNINRLGHLNGIYFNDDKDRSEIPLHMIIKNSEGNFTTKSDARKLLEENYYVIEECLINGTEDTCVIYSPIMDNNSTSPISDFTEDEDEQDNWNSANDNENWDLEYSDSCFQKYDSGIVESNSEKHLKSKEAVADVFKVLETNIGREINNFGNCSRIGQDTAKKSTFKVSTQQKMYKSVAIDDGKKNTKVKDEENKIRNNGASTSKAYACSLTTEPVPSTSNSKRKKKRKLDTDEDITKEEIKNITKTLLYNTLNIVDGNDETRNIPEIKLRQLKTNINHIAHSSSVMLANPPELSAQISEKTISKVEFLGEPSTSINSNNENSNILQECELAHASREALFDPNSQVSILDEFGGDDNSDNWDDDYQDEQRNEHHGQVVLIGVNVNNNDEDNELLRLPVNANPFPNWLLQLLSANAIEAGNESHDEPHFYCQGDGIGVHPSIVEVDLEEELSSSDSSSNEGDDAEGNASDPDVPQIPQDDLEEGVEENPLEVFGVSLGTNESQSSIIQSPSNHESVDEFYDTIDDSVDENLSTFGKK